MGLLGYFVTGDWKEIDSRTPTGWATKNISKGSSTHQEEVHCPHEWKENGREGLGWTGGDYYGGRGECVSQVHYTCRRCEDVKIEDERS